MFIPSQVRGKALIHKVITKQVSTESTTFIGVESPAAECAKAINGGDDLTDMMTKFLSLDKCLPRKHYLQIINIPNPDMPQEHGGLFSSSDASLHYDLEWLAILQKTHHWTNKYRSRNPDPDIADVHIRQEDIDNIRQKLKLRLKSDIMNKGCPNPSNDTNNTIDETRIPNDFTMTAHPHGNVGSDTPMGGGKMIGNPQTDKILSLLDLDHIITTPYLFASETTGVENSYSSKQQKEELFQMESDRVGLHSHSDHSGKADTHHQPDANEIDLESDSKSESESEKS